MAERIARRVASQPIAARNPSPGDLGSELAAMRASLSELQNRLTQIESRVRGGTSFYPTSPASPQVHSPWLEGVNSSHPSQERFGVEEATVTELVDYFQSEKACSMEPGGKPCDHCPMCSSRGF